jgi:taurine dioxygenase
MEEYSEAVTYDMPSGLKVRRLQPTIGALLSNVDLAKPLSSAMGEDIRQALWAHGVIFFRDQPVDYDAQFRLTALFGEPVNEVTGSPEQPALAAFKADSGAKGDASGHWHSDGTWAEIPPIVSVLRAVKAADLGGDTWFSSATAAYEGLPDEVKARIAPLRALSSVAHGTRLSNDNEKVALLRAAYPPIDQPVVRIHPATGKPALYVNENHTTAIVGMENEEGQALLDYLTRQFTRPEYQVAWQWEDDSIAVWDNAGVQHYAVPGHIGFRHVERMKATGTRPIGITEAGAARLSA